LDNYPSDIREYIDWNRTNVTLANLALRNHDPEIFYGVYDRIAEKIGATAATEFLFDLMTKAMTNEGWSFVDKNGNPSPLL
jgi:hypothetical protein